MITGYSREKEEVKEVEGFQSNSGPLKPRLTFDVRDCLCDAAQVSKKDSS